MFFNPRQLPSVRTPGFAMSNTTGQGNAQPTEEASVPGNQPTSPADNNSDANAQPTSPAEDTGNASPTAPEQTSDPANNEPSATNNEPSDAATETAAEPTDDNASPTESNTPAEETNGSSPSSANNPASPTPTQDNAATTEADQTSQGPESSPTNDNNDDTTSEDNQASETEVSEALSTVVTVTGTSGPQTTLVVLTSITTNRVTAAEPSASSTSTDEAEAIDTSKNDGGGLDQKSKVAIGVAVPIAAIALLALLGLFWWKKRKTRRLAEEERRKEVEDYAYNPNADPTIPAVGMADGGYEMREDGSSGYRGWGNTTIGSTGRKASTTMSGGVNGQAYSDVTSPTRGNMSDARSGEPLMDGSHSPEGEILGAMGPSAANNRGADVHRGASNASSSYSAAARSDASDGMGAPYGAGGSYYDQYAQNNPYSDNGPQQAVIRDNPARRNTRIENPSHYPQQSAGISQNF
ncbi:hypothetical protein ACJ41O_014033 [Fusarium nematophilum]